MSNPEHKLQAQCVIEFSSCFPLLRGSLWANFSETQNAIQGSQMNSLGLIRGIPDLFFIKDRELTGIEIKAPNSSHNRIHLIEQADWLIKFPANGWFCDSLEMFMEIISGGKGISPHIVKQNCLKLITKTVQWENIKGGQTK